MDLQLALPLEADSRNEAALRQAWMRSGLALSYELALRDRAIAICLRCLADAMRTAHRSKRYGQSRSVAQLPRRRPARTRS